MRIISHRGYWIDFKSESNKRVAFERSFDLGFGTETDLRDINGKIVISHNMPVGDEITFEEVLQIMDGRNLPLALNIKADGQADEIERLLKKYGHTDYFTFDMSIPDLVYQTEKTNLRIYTGCSDILPEPVLMSKCVGIWLDSFYDPWYQIDRIQGFLDAGKEVCIVSEDLHSRKNDDQWEIIKGSSCFSDGRLMLCTNYPEDAAEYFYQ